MHPSAPLPLPPNTLAASGAQADVEPPHPGDLVIVARVFNTLEAEMLRGCLEAEGIPARLGDAQMIQTDTLLTGALGGVRVMVPAPFEDTARRTVAAFDRGEFAIDELPPEAEAMPSEAEAASRFGMPRMSLLVILVLTIAGLIDALARPGATMH